MARMLTISETLYDELDAEARRRGLSIEELLEQWRSTEELDKRQEAVARVERLERRLRARYGDMPDSTELVREDRAR